MKKIVLTLVVMLLVAGSADALFTGQMYKLVPKKGIGLYRGEKDLVANQNAPKKCTLTECKLMLDNMDMYFISKKIIGKLIKLRHKFSIETIFSSLSCFIFTIKKIIYGTKQVI